MTEPEKTRALLLFTEFGLNTTYQVRRLYAALGGETFRAFDPHQAKRGKYGIVKQRRALQIIGA
ncbi:MAG: hypothetical protein AAF625_01950 [Pseudomonadota bacterium]